MAKTDVAQAKSTAVAGSYDYGDMAHEGFEDTSIADLSIPFLALLQALSEAVEEQTAEGCKAGDMMNSVTKELVPQPLNVIPVYKEESWVRWGQNKTGLQGRFEPNSPEVQGFIKKNGGSRIPPKDAEGKTIPFRDEQGNDVIETYYVYCLVLDEDLKSTVSYIVVPFSSTKITVYKNWMTALYTQKGRPPMFANRASISTTKQKFAKGSAFNFLIKPAKDTWRESLINPAEEMELLEEARAFKEMIENGLARPDFDSANATSEGSSGGSQSSGDSGQNGDDDEMPF